MHLVASCGCVGERPTETGRERVWGAGEAPRLSSAPAAPAATSAKNLPSKGAPSSATCCCSAPWLYAWVLQQAKGKGGCPNKMWEARGGTSAAPALWPAGKTILEKTHFFVSFQENVGWHAVVLHQNSLEKRGVCALAGNGAAKSGALKAEGRVHLRISDAKQTRVRAVKMGQTVLCCCALAAACSPAAAR